MAQRVLWESGGTAEVIAREALELFHAKGYHATSIRDIATAANVATSTLFHHYASKEDLLARIMLHSLTETIERVQRADDSAADPTGRIRAVVTALVLVHTEMQHESFVNNAELRSLSPLPAKEVIAARRRIGEMVADIVVDGIASGDFDVDSADEVTTAIITMVMAVATWFRASGPRTAEQIAESYVQFAMRLLGVKQQPHRQRSQGRAEEPTVARSGSVSKSAKSALRVQSQ